VGALRTPTRHVPALTVVATAIDVNCLLRGIKAKNSLMLNRCLRLGDDRFNTREFQLGYRLDMSSYVADKQGLVGDKM
jgi:hypothetical protein